MRLGGVFPIACAALVVVACSSFGSGGATAPAPDGGSGDDAGGNPPPPPGDGGGGCTPVLDEKLLTGPGQLTEVHTDDGGVVVIDGGALVAQVDRPSGGGQAQLNTVIRPFAGTFARARMTFTVGGLQPSTPNDYVRVGCTLKLRVDPADIAKGESEIYLRLRGSQVALGELDHLEDGGAKVAAAQTLLMVPPAGTSFTATIETVAGAANVTSTATAPGATATPQVASMYPDIHGWQIKCGIDESDLDQDAGDAPYTLQVKDVKLEICTR